MKRIAYIIGLAATVAALLVPAAGATVYRYDPNGYYEPVVQTDPWFQHLRARNEQVPVTSVTPIADSGTDWSTIGFGLGAGVFALVLGAGLLVAVRRPRGAVHA